MFYSYRLLHSVSQRRLRHVSHTSDLGIDQPIARWWEQCRTAFLPSASQPQQPNHPLLAVAVAVTVADAQATLRPGAGPVLKRRRHASLLG